MLKQTTSDVIRESHEPQILPCTMTEAEVQGEQSHLLQVMQEADDLESQRKAVASDFKARKDKQDEILMDCRKKLRSRQVMRSIPCTLHMNFSKLTVTTVREDTGETINERPMTQDERRMLNAMDPLPGMEDVDAKPVGDPIKFPVTDTTPTDPPETEQMTEEQVDAHATEMFGPIEVAGVDINGAADLSEDEDDEYGFGNDEEETE